MFSTHPSHCRDHLCCWKTKKKKKDFKGLFHQTVSGAAEVMEAILLWYVRGTETTLSILEIKRTVCFLPPEHMPRPSYWNKTEAELFERGGGGKDGRRERRWDLKCLSVLILMSQLLLFTYLKGVALPSMVQGCDDLLQTKYSHSLFGLLKTKTVWV